MVAVGAAPVTPGLPAQLAASITQVSHDVFTSGMNAAFLTAAIVALAGAFIALLTRRPEADGDRPDGATSTGPRPATEVRALRVRALRG